MKRKYENLCRPLRIGNVTFRNRMFSAPMGGTDITNDGCIGSKSTVFYELRGKGVTERSPALSCLIRACTRGLT